MADVALHRVFVYGSLKPGRERWSSLEPFVDPATAPAEAHVRGQLWRTPWGWPALTDGPDDVPGVLVTLTSSSVDAALAVLDAIEGTDRGLFDRVAVETLDGTPCWTYRWPSGTSDFEAVVGPW